jgi:hypothetical protein
VGGTAGGLVRVRVINEGFVSLLGFQYMDGGEEVCRIRATSIATDTDSGGTIA